MSRLLRACVLLAAAIATQAVTSCLHKQSPELTKTKNELILLQAEREKLNYQENTYSHFVCHNGYPNTMKIFCRTDLMAKADKSSRVVICLDQQRGRLYVDDFVAADWPVSTGIPGRATPTGNYTVIEKKETYASNRYGKIYDAEGNCINRDADAIKDEIPEGGKFEGSPMPYWQRLTGDGVGMHVGKVVAGKRLSHGCIRTPKHMAKELYRVTRIGTKVTVCQKIEPEFPVPDALRISEIRKELDAREAALKKKIAELTPAT